MLESTIVRKIKKYLEDRGAFVVKTHGNQYSTTGTPDLLCCYKGYFIALEVKTPGKIHNVTKIQAHCIQRIKECGGYASIVSSEKEVVGILTTIDLHTCLRESPSFIYGEYGNKTRKEEI